MSSWYYIIVFIPTWVVFWYYNHAWHCNSFASYERFSFLFSEKINHHAQISTAIFVIKGPLQHFEFEFRPDGLCNSLKIKYRNSKNLKIDRSSDLDRSAQIFRFFKSIEKKKFQVLYWIWTNFTAHWPKFKFKIRCRGPLILALICIPPPLHFQCDIK